MDVFVAERPERCHTCKSYLIRFCFMPGADEVWCLTCGAAGNHDAVINGTAGLVPEIDRAVVENRLGIFRQAQEQHALADYRDTPGGPI